MEESAALESVQQLLFEAPLYETFGLQHDFSLVEQLYGRSKGTLKFDEYCPQCNASTTYTLNHIAIPGGSPWNDIASRFAYDSLSVTCGRNDGHRVRYFLRVDHLTITKVGQFPSLADIANDEVAQFRNLMSKQDGAEFHKAIGLAAHGVGVGSFVYLRRVFERLVYQRFHTFKAAESWKDEEFFPLSMNDKIRLLQHHLPQFLVENARIYSILSIGIHELDEQKCLAFFEVMKRSIMIILREDQQKKTEAAERDAFAKAIAQFN